VKQAGFTADGPVVQGLCVVDVGCKACGLDTLPDARGLAALWNRYWCVLDNPTEMTSVPDRWRPAVTPRTYALNPLTHTPRHNSKNSSSTFSKGTVSRDNLRCFSNLLYCRWASSSRNLTVNRLKFNYNL
jgi:hypothetical protein